MIWTIFCLPPSFEILFPSQTFSVVQLFVCPQSDLTTVLILLEEIIRNHQINMLLISLMITFIFSKNRKRKRWDRLGQSIVLDSIPDHVRQMDRLVRVTDRACVDNLRMDRNTFGRLCRILRDRVGLIDQKRVTVEEQVTMFLCVLAHHQKSRIVGHNFMRSSQTVSKYIHTVLRGALTLHSLFLVTSIPIDEACTDRRWKWFKVHSPSNTYINRGNPDDECGLYCACRVA